ncbi:MAG: hypothetical protein ACOCSE_02480, partial [Chitinivibrionales bacterium]
NTGDTDIGFVAMLDDTVDDPVEFLYNMEVGLECEIGALGFGAGIVVKNDTIGFREAFLNMKALKDWDVVKKPTGEQEKDAEKALEDSETNGKRLGGGSIGTKVGVMFKDVYWVYDEDKEKHTFRKDDVQVLPLINTTVGFDILGVGVQGTFDFTHLFREKNPGVAVNDIALTLSEDLVEGGSAIKTGMCLFIDGKKPYIHPQYDKGSRVKLNIPGISLTDDIQLADAMMEFGVEPPNEEVDYENWYFGGKATMGLSGVVDEISVDVAFEKPHPWECVTGIRHAKVTVKLAENCRIPIGSTPFYLSGFFGAMYDGTGTPEGAISCGIPSLPPGLKLEAAIFIEFKKPEVVNGRIGFWVHLYKLNFGVNGEVTALEGIGRADACMALYNNGSAFHGHFRAIIEAGLAVKGKFVIDVWRDNTGGNLTGEATASIGLTRGSLIDKWFIHIPSKTKWFGGLFTKFGKFKNEKKGITTGIRICRKSFGLGVIGGSFKIGKMGKFKLKESPIKLPPLRMVLPDGSEVSEAEYTIEDPGLNLEGGEVLSIVAGKDNASEWSEHSLRFAYINEQGDTVIDNNGSHYIAYDEGSEDGSSESEGESFNIKRRVYRNPGHDRVLIVFPKDPDTEYEYILFPGIPEPDTSDIDITVDVEDIRTDDREDKYAVFNGSVENFKPGIQIIEKDTGTGVIDTVLKQEHLLNLMYAQLAPKDIDSLKSETYPFRHVQIPITQFEGYTEGDTSLIQNPSVDYIEEEERLEVNDLKWRCSNGFPGKLGFSAAIDMRDYIVHDDRGREVVMPLDSAESLNLFCLGREFLKQSQDADSVKIIDNDFEIPLKRVQELTATGSPVDSGWKGDDERRKIFLRWQDEDNPTRSGYRIYVCPSGMEFDSAHTRRFTAGNTNNYSIEIPDIPDSLVCMDTTDTNNYRGSADVYYDTTYNDSTYYDSLAQKEVTWTDTIYKVNWDSTVTTSLPKIYAGSIDTAYYYADSFDVCIAPMKQSIEVREESDWRGTGKTHTDTLIRYYPDMRYADTLRDIPLGQRNLQDAQGNNPERNDFSIEFSKDGEEFTSGDHVDVPLNRSGEVSARLTVPNTSFDTSGTDASNYGEIFARIDTNSLPDSLKAAMPSAGAADYYFAVDDTIIREITFTPVTEDVKCGEMFDNTCEKVVYDDYLLEGNADTINTCSTCCEGNISSDTILHDDEDSCSRNAPENALPRMSPCDGKPDSLIRMRTPYGSYKVYVYAMNSGRRAVPGQEPGASVIDSINFRVAPEAPVVHNVFPDRVINRGISNSDTISFAVNNIKGIDSGITPIAKVKWMDEDYNLDSAYIDNCIFNSMSDTGLYSHSGLVKNSQGEAEFETQAEYEVLVSFDDYIFAQLNSVTSDSLLTELKISFLNRDIDFNGDTITSESNSKMVRFVDNADDVECNENMTTDFKNADYAMNWVGVYPKFPSPGDTVVSYFSDLHDYTEENYKITIFNQDTTYEDTLDIIKITDYGVLFIIPNEIDNSFTITVQTIISDDNKAEKCQNNKYLQDIFITTSRFKKDPNDTSKYLTKYDIVPEPGGFRIRLVGDTSDVTQYMEHDVIKY